MTKQAQQRHPDCPPCPPCPQPPDPPAGGQGNIPYPSTVSEYSTWLVAFCQRGNDHRLLAIADHIIELGGLTLVSEAVANSEIAFETSRDPRVRAVGDAVAKNLITTINDLMAYAEAAVGNTGDTRHRAMGRILEVTKPVG